MFDFEKDAGDKHLGLRQRKRDFGNDEVNHQQIDRRLLWTHLDEMVGSSVRLMTAVVMIGVVRFVMNGLDLSGESLRMVKVVFCSKMEIGVANLKDE